MTPPRAGRPRRRTRPEPDLVPLRRRRKGRGRRKRSVLFSCLIGTAVVLVVAGAGVTGVATFGSGCNLNALRPVAIGQNSFVYAADNSILGAIPAERNRQPVALDEISPWMPKATVSIEDRRFYEHGGVDVEGIVRALWADLEAALGVLRDEGGAGAEVFVASLEGPPSLVLRAWAADARAAEALEQELRLRIQSRLRREGVLS